MEQRPQTNQERVELGIQYLNTVYPGWQNRINLETLSINSTIECVLSQVHDNNFYRTPESDNFDAEWLDDHGFDIDWGDDEDFTTRTFAMLTGEWKRQIENLTSRKTL